VPEVQAVVDEIEKPAAVEPSSSAASAPPPAARPRQVAAAAATPVTKDPPQELVDPEIHYLARLGFARPVRALALGDLMHHAATLGKPLLWAGLEAARQEWEEVTPFRNHDYVELVAGIQLADRNGALSEDSLERFCHQLKAFAVKHGGRVACPDQMSALDRAGALDIFCVDVDVLIGLNVIAQGSTPFPALQVGKLAEDAGMELSDEGVFHFRDERGESLFSLCNHDSAPFSKGKLEGMSTRGVTLLLDVPRVGDGIHVFDRMVALGRKLANEFGGLLVDDNNRPLSEAGIAKIRHQLTGIYAKMEERGVPPGGARALRLFR
jgi:hypothetical protein